MAWTKPLAWQMAGQGWPRSGDVTELNITLEQPVCDESVL
jgi:hypothetical protein